MKKNDLKTIYGKSSPDFHNRVVETLNSLDEKNNQPLKNSKKVRRIAVIACAATLAVAMTTVAAATGMFGLFSQKTGNYGLSVKVENQESSTTSQPSKPKYVKALLDYIPEGYENISNNVHSYHYCYNGKFDYSKWSFHISIDDSDSYDETMQYVVESSETEYNGNKTIIYKQQQWYADTDVYSYGAIEYFEDFGKVVTITCQDYIDSYPSYEEFINIVKGLQLEEYPDYEEPDISLRDTYSDADFENNILQNFGQDFNMTSLTEGGLTNLVVNVKSVEEKTSSDGLEKLDFFHETDFSIHDQYFDSDKQLITPYTRVDIESGDGINSLSDSKEVEDNRHFYIISIDVTSLNNDIDNVKGDMFRPGIAKYINGKVEYYSYGGEVREIYIKDSDEPMSLKTGETKTYTYGVIVDDDALDNAYITVENENTTIKDSEQMIYHDINRYLISLKDR